MATLESIIGGEAINSLKDHGIAEGTATAKAALFAEVTLAPVESSRPSCRFGKRRGWEGRGRGIAGG